MFEKKPQKLTERERQQQTALRERCAVLGKKYQTLFWVSIISVIISVVMLVMAYATRSAGAVLVLAASAIVLGIIYAVTLFTLGQYNENYTLAGVAYILLQVTDFIKQMAGGEIGMLFSLASLGLGIGYVLKYTLAMEECFTLVDGYISDSWASYRKAYIGVTIGSIACVVLAFVPFLAFLAVVGSVILAIVAIGLSIWQLVILNRSANRMIEFSNTPIEG